MKKLVTLLLTLLTFIVSAQNTVSVDPFYADSLQYHFNEDSSEVTVVVVAFAGTVNREQFNQFVDNRVKVLNNQASQYDQLAAERREKAQREREKYQKQTGKDPSELFKDLLEKIAGDWQITINDKSDRLRIATDGSFTSQKSGNGTIKPLAQDYFILQLDSGTKLELYRKGDGWTTAEGKSVVLKRIG